MLGKLLVFSLTVYLTCAFIPKTKQRTSADFLRNQVEADVPHIKINVTAIDAFITSIIKCRDSLSAVALAIVQLDEDDNVVGQYNRAYGTVDQNDKDEEISEFDRFCIGSITKQFTAALVGVALEKHRMDYDAKILDLLGEEGRFFDEKGLDQLPTVRDLLSHRMAIPRYDTAWLVGLNGTRLDYWPHLHSLADTDEDYISERYRSSFEYNNWMVALAGYITERLTNFTWEADVEEKYFRGLGLDNATFAHLTLYDHSFALPAYRVVNDTDPSSFYWIPLNKAFMRETVEKVAPAGSICLSSRDMLKYMTFLLSTNASDDKELRMLKKKITQTMEETSNYLNVEAVSSSPEGPLYAIDNYALNWVRGFYRDYELTYHDGSISGYYSYEALFRKLKLGIFVSTTNGFLDTDLSAFITVGLFDLIMNTNDQLSADKICALPPSTAQTKPSDDPFLGCDDTKDFLNLEPLAGTYRHEVFGDIVIRYNRSEENAKDRFTFEYGKFFRGMLCPKVDDPELKEFRLFVDPETPLWFVNDPTTALETGMMFIFGRDKAERGTRIVFPGLELQAPSVNKQTYFKMDYHPCDPNPCQNGGACTLDGDLDFVCYCPPMTNGTVCEQVTLKDCSDWKKYHPELSEKSGMYQIEVPYGHGSSKTYNVWCDMEDNGGGWTVIHRRVDDSVLFNATWDDYESGFGKPFKTHNYWFGLEGLNHLAGSDNNSYTLKIDLQDCMNRSVSETYENFWIENNLTDYKLHVRSGSASGAAGDALTISNSYISQNNMPFSTPDRDDVNRCATTYNSGWWFNDCFASNLNGKYYPSCKATSDDGIVWLPFRKYDYSMQFAQMKIRQMMNYYCKCT